MPFGINIDLENQACCSSSARDNILGGIIYQLRFINNDDPRFHLQGNINSGYISCIVGGQGQSTKTIFDTLQRLDAIIANYYPGKMPALYIWSLIKLLTNHLVTLTPREKDEYFNIPNVGDSFLFTDELNQCMLYANDASALRDKLNECICEAVTANCYRNGVDLSFQIPDNIGDSFLPPPPPPPNVCNRFKHIGECITMWYHCEFRHGSSIGTMHRQAASCRCKLWFKRGHWIFFCT